MRMASTTFKSALAGIVACAALASGAEAQAQGKLSDKSVNTLMEYAWQILPAKFTTPEGKVIEVDKSKRDGNIVPGDNGREIIRVGYNSAQAQVCELWDEQQANYDTLMRRELVKKNLTYNLEHFFVMEGDLGLIRYGDARLGAMALAA